MEYTTINELVETAKENGISVGEAVLKDQAAQMEQTEEHLLAQMEESLQVMEKAVESGMDPGLRSTSGLTGGDAWKMMKYGKTGGMTGSFMTGAMARALAVSEYNAAMGKIVAAPTAGSCGIMPGCLVSVMKERGIAREKILRGMFTAAGFGMVIAKRASVSGAQGGCQAECGSAAAMAAGAAVSMLGGTPQQVGTAVAVVFKNVLGLVCDPVAGLVEVPCIKRNGACALQALLAAELALAGISSFINADEAIDAMKSVGDALPCALKETAGGGMAATPSAIEWAKKYFGRK